MAVQFGAGPRSPSLQQVPPADFPDPGNDLLVGGFGAGCARLLIGDQPHVGSGRSRYWLWPRPSMTLASTVLYGRNVGPGDRHDLWWWVSIGKRGVPHLIRPNRSNTLVPASSARWRPDTNTTGSISIASVSAATGLTLEIDCQTSTRRVGFVRNGHFKSISVMLVSSSPVCRASRTTMPLA
jgi:hypothetical protein